ncbi:MAG: hypothetical protein PHO48_04145 [Candidatus Gracilibacteria bacterium]|nr:hypothetical protein [Candidatus Gracilibacteria bacterium]MDD5179029.1 hypothetical protein [Candidatus Gracilibacteria bacterium]
MKKIFASALLSLLLAGCFGSGVTEEKPTDTTAQKEEVAPTLAENAFVAMSAEILCLPTNYPDSTPAEIETEAKAILAKNNISEEDFNTYQAKVSKDDTEKMRLSYEIIGKMGDYCEIIKPGEAANTPATTDETVSAEATTSEATTDTKTTTSAAEEKTATPAADSTTKAAE